MDQHRQIPPRTGLRMGKAAMLASALLAITGLMPPGGQAYARAPQPKSGNAMLGFDDVTMAKFKTRVAVNKDVATAWGQIKDEADGLANQPPDRITSDPRKLGKPLDSLVLAWRMTGDKRYAERIHELLLRMCNQPNWVTDKALLQRDPPWNSDLGMGFEGEMFGRA